MRYAMTLTMVLLLAMAGGCKQNQNEKASAGVAASGDAATAVSQSASQQNQLTPEQLGELGAQIRKTPDRAAELLQQHGLTEQSFEAQIRKVTENPDASKRYASAYRKANA